MAWEWSGRLQAASHTGSPTRALGFTWRSVLFQSAGLVRRVGSALRPLSRSCWLFMKSDGRELSFTMTERNLDFREFLVLRIDSQQKKK